MKNLIIVCEKEYKKIGDYITQLITLNDDTLDDIVGTKDGEVKAIVWDEKIYKDNFVKLTSNSYVLFIGGKKFIKQHNEFAKTEYCEYGVRYGWLGRKAILTVEKTITADKYDSFLEFARTYEKNFNAIIDGKSKTITKANKAINGAAAAAALIDPVSTVLVSIFAMKQLKSQKEVQMQQYSFGAIKFYMDDLSKFLEL